MGPILIKKAASTENHSVETALFLRSPPTSTVETLIPDNSSIKSQAARARGTRR